MSDKIPVLDLKPEVDALWAELRQAIDGVLKNTAFIMGPDVKAFESEVATYLGVEEAIGCNSGTDALLIGLRALGIGVGDEVITTSFTFIATAEAISLAGAVPVFVDIDPRTYNLDPAEVAKAITPRTRAIMPVHLYGHPAEMDPLLELARKHDLKIVEDVAQAFSGSYRGRKLGTIGDVGAYSFFPSKNLGAFGDGGLITCRDAAVAEKARMLRVHGAKKKYYNEILGYNSRLDTLQAAILRVKLPHIDEWSAGRRQAAAYYTQRFAKIDGVTPPFEADYATAVYHQYTIRIAGGKRDAVQQKLTEQGVGTMVYYPVPAHKLPVYESLGYRLPNAEQAAGEVLSLPIWPTISPETQDIVISAVRKAI